MYSFAQNESLAQHTKRQVGLLPGEAVLGKLNTTPRRLNIVVKQSWILPSMHATSVRRDSSVATLLYKKKQDWVLFLNQVPCTSFSSLRRTSSSALYSVHLLHAGPNICCAFMHRLRHPLVNRRLLPNTRISGWLRTVSKLLACLCRLWRLVRP